MQADFRSYDLISLAAGRKAGLDMPDAIAASRLTEVELQPLLQLVADNRKAAKIRDEWFVDFERRLTDSGYSGDQVCKWFIRTYGPIGRSSIFRVRAKLRATNSQIQQIAAEAQAFVDLASEHGRDAIFDAANKRSAQLLFQLLMEAKADQFEGRAMDIKKLSTIVKALANLQKATAETDLLQHRLAEIRKAAKAETQKLAAAAKDGRLGREDVYAILDKIMKGEAA